jgi:hypothetical protein
VIVNTGKIKLLNQKLAYLAGLSWGLFTNNVTILNTTLWTGLTEATWGGYARVVAGTWGAPSIVSGKAVSQPNAFPSFGNTSGINQQFFGWFLLDSADNTLVAAVNVGVTTLLPGGNYPLVPSMTEDQQ